MIRRRAILGSLVALSCLVSLEVRAETKRNTPPFSRFKVMLGGILNDTVPFDVPFIIHGDVKESVTHVRLRIAKLPEGTNCAVIPGTGYGAVSRVEATEWTQRDYEDRGLAVPGDLATVNLKQFEFLIEPLQPHALYCFLFQTEPGEPLSPAQVSLLAARLPAGYQAFLRARNDTRDVDDKDIEGLRQQLIASLFNTIPFEGFVPRQNSVFDPAAPPELVSQQFKTMAAASLGEHINVIRGLRALEGLLDPQAFSAKVKRWQTWLPAARELFSSRAAALPAQERADLKYVTSLQGDAISNLLRGAAEQSSGDLLTEVWQPDAGLPPPPAGGYQPSSPCPNSGELRFRCAQLDQAIATLDRVTALFARERSADKASLTAIQDTLDDLRETKIELLDIQHAVNQRDALIREHIKMLEGSVFADIFTLVPTMGNLDTRRSWYISADTGLALAPFIEEVFPYVGSNIYFRAVNKEAPPGPFLTRFSALLGFTWTDLKKAGQRQPLYGEDGMLVVGGGLRFSNTIRLNGGLLLFKGVDPNPLVDKTRLEYTPFFSISADVDIGGMIEGMFGKPPTPGALGAVAPQK